MGSYLAFCGKACAAGALALLLAVMPTNAPAPAARVAPNQTPSQAPASQYTSAQITSLVTSARTLEPYLVRESNGTLTLNAPAGVITRLPATDVRALGTGLNALNAKIAAGQLQTAPGGAVFSPVTDFLTLQGGWSGYGQNWWHSYWCLNHSDVQIMNSGWWWDMSTAALFGLALIANVIAVAVGIVIYLYKAWMTADDHGNGSCLNFGHWPPPNIWVSSQ